MSKKKLISLVLAIMLLFSAVVPISSAFGAEEKKYHPDDWFGYTHTKAEINGWIKDAVKYPTTSEDAIKALKGEIRPGDVISFQVEVEMPTGHEEVIQFMKDFNFNMTFPFGVNAMIEVYSPDAPLLTDEEYQKRIYEFNYQIDELEQLLNDEEVIQDIETDLEAKSLYNTYKDMVENRDKYYEIYLNQLEIAKTEYGFIDGSYGTADTWMGIFENNPNLDVEEGTTYESFRDQVKEDTWVDPKITDEEFELLVSEFNEKYPSIIEEYMAFYEEAKEEYDRGEISEADWPIITTAMESIYDGTFYDTVIQYFEDCRDGYFPLENDYGSRFIALLLSGMDCYHAYSGQYSFKFPDSIVQRNQQRSYIFDINIVATEALSVGSYFSLPSLHWYYIENCPSFWIELFPLQSFNYYPCNSRCSSFLNFGNTYYVNNSFISNDDTDDLNGIVYKDKRYLAMEYISTEFGDEDYSYKLSLEYFGGLLQDNALKAIRPFTVECRDENGNIIKSETVETYDAYYDIVPEEIYDYQLVGPENIKGVINNEDTTVTFYYERKDAEINVHFIDVDGNELLPAQKIQGKTLDEYQAAPAVIYGYNVVQTSENVSGILHEDSDDVWYIYKIKSTTVLVNYLDTDGKTIAKSDIIYGGVFEEYSTVPKKIDGYELVEVPDNASGKMEEEVITVDYIYQPIIS